MLIYESFNQQFIYILTKGGIEVEEECGIFGIYAPDQDVAQLTYYGLYALQHRGQESTGISVSNSNKLVTNKNMGLVNEVFDEHNLSELTGISAIGHVRYTTEGDSSVVNAQPLTVKCKLGELSVAHNGNLINSEELRNRLEKEGTIFHTNSDSEILAHLLAKSQENDLLAAFQEVIKSIQGAYNFLMLTPDKILAVRDPWGFRPLSLGKVAGNYVVASETCAFDTIGAEFLRDIEPGEMVCIDHNGLNSYQVFEKTKPSLCMFEYIYFARPDSNINNRNVHLVRKELGRELAKELPEEIPAKADLVSGVPDSSLSAASGVSEELPAPYEMALIKNRYVGRTFIKPNQTNREISVKIKLNPVERTVANKNLILVDDSIVRGTTISNIIKTLKKSGTSQIHVLVSSPPVKYPCCFGIDTSTSSELIASNQSVSNIKDHIQADSLQYLSVEGMLRAVNNVSKIQNNEGFCLACFNGENPSL
ncbi:amidophosphoribosyltransferase [Natranaerobius thermophilus JW/NM-WN-LF]|uniref:Amidophosphoribosyltransferase n=1 Tax=Natranaerobius thermophilus (strain ATCC BAA-1301 / DSM 18059 / JW/NM-WN-LF) TaxID=457570 RepID=B2A1J0_NATTJ|nr:amidophosphoribosyltransferase [Natranaerobius thermophilus JW/NM-WN-LF]